MPRWSLWFLGVVLCAAFIWIGCCSIRSVSPPSATHGPHTIYLVEHGWHAGIVISRADVAAYDWAVLKDFPNARYIEVGWGDADYYQAADPGIGTTLKAGLWPTESVLHVAAFRDPPPDAFPGRTIIRMRVSTEGIAALLEFIRREHERGPDGALISYGSGLYGRSRFYAARSRYHVLHNCNTWAARALEEADCSMAPARAPTVRLLVNQARDCGAVIHQSD